MTKSIAPTQEASSVNEATHLDQLIPLQQPTFVSLQHGRLHFGIIRPSHLSRQFNRQPPLLDGCNQTLLSLAQQDQDPANVGAV
ncbi:hypothetical protein D3C78_1539730 [compost metagenome]